MKIIEGGYNDRPLSGPWSLPDLNSFPEESPISSGRVDEKENTGSFEWEPSSKEQAFGYEKDTEHLETRENTGLYAPKSVLEPKIKKDIPSKTVQVDSVTNKVEQRPRGNFMQKLLTTEGIYMGLVMSEILGPRKGLGRRR